MVKSVRAEHETSGSLVAAMLGRAAVLSFPAKRPPGPDAGDALAVRDLAGAGTVSGVSFAVRRGEIVGLAGLAGRGRTEVARLIFGADRRTHGEIDFDGRPVSWRSTRAVIRSGVSNLPESRKDLGLFLRMSSQENVTLSHLGR